MKDSVIKKPLRKQFYTCVTSLRSDQCTNSKLNIAKRLENIWANLPKSAQISQEILHHRCLIGS